jgi:hypothetical protein
MRLNVAFARTEKMRQGLTEDLGERLELGMLCRRGEAMDKEYRDR